MTGTEAIKLAKQFQYLAKKRFGMLLTSDYVRRRAKGGFECLCFCDCGQKSWIRTCDITSGHVKSCGCKRTKDPVQAARNIVLDNYKRNASKRHLQWSLSDDVFDLLIQQRCFYCSREPNNRCRRFVYNGIDRKDNAIGYTVGNSIPCCVICNRAKNNMSFAEFESWLQDIGRKYGTQ